MRGCAGMDYDTGRSKGFAHVQFEGVEGAAAAIGMSGVELDGRQLFIDTAKERADRPQSGQNNRGVALLAVLCHHCQLLCLCAFYTTGCTRWKSGCCSLMLS